MPGNYIVIQRSSTRRRGFDLPPTPSFTSTWQDVLLGGGGFQRTLDVHADGTIVTGCDVYGAYIGSTKPGVLRQLVTTTSMPASFWTSVNPYQGGGSLCVKIAPSNSNVLYMSYTPFIAANSVILVSQDKGYTWKDSNFGTYTANANGGTANYSQPRIAIDPNDPNTCYVGTEAAGMWKTNNGLAATPAWTQVTVNSFPTTASDPGVTSMQFDPTSGTTGGKTNRLIVGVNGSGLWVTADAGATWAKIAASPLNPGHGKMGSDGTYYLTLLDGSAIWRLSTGNALTSMGPSDGQAYFELAIDPNNPARGVADRSGGYLNVCTSAINSGATTWSIWNQNHRVNAGPGQPPWAQNSNDSFLTDGGMFFDPLTTTSAVSATPGNGTFTFNDVPAGLNIAVGDCLRFSSAASPSANFLTGYVTAYAGTSLTISLAVAATTTASVSPGLGTRTFAGVPSGLSFVIGGYVTASQTSSTNNNVTGTVVSYNSGTNTLVINAIDAAGGGGPFSDWTIKQGDFGGSGAHTDWKIGKERLWFSMGLGILYTDNIQVAPASTVGPQQQWFAQFAGIENLVVNQVVWPPGGNPFAACWDRPFWNLAGPGTYQANYFPAYVPYGQNAVIFGASVDYAKGAARVLVGLGGNSSGGGYSLDGGATWNDFAAPPPGAFGNNGGGGTIVAFDATRFLFVRANNGGMYRTANAGASWTECLISGVPCGIQPSSTSNNLVASGPLTFTVPTALNYVAAQALTIFETTGFQSMSASVTSYNSGTGALVVSVSSSTATGGPFTGWLLLSQNAGWGANASNASECHLTADCVEVGTAYAYNNGNSPGIYKTTDFGATWALGFSSLIPSDNGFLPQIGAVPKLGTTNTAGHLFATVGQAADLGTTHPQNLSLQRSTDHGATLQPVANVLEVITFGFGSPKPGNAYPAIYVVGWVSLDSGVTYNYGVWRSDDNCVSWTKMIDFVPRGNIDPGLGGWLDEVTTIAGNPNRWNSCIVGYQGSSFAYFGPPGSYN